MADVVFVCPQCGHPYPFAAHLAGKRGRCKSCDAVFQIPDASPAVRGGMSSAPTSRSSSSALTAPVSVPSSPPPTADGGRIAFNCPTCGHGYRLDAKLAGKQGRCTSCRGVFTIPSPSRSAADGPSASPSADPRDPQPAAGMVAAGPPPSQRMTGPSPSWSSATPAPARGGRAAAPAMTAVDDSEWWELDSSESVPAVMARPGSERPRTAKPVARPAASRPAAVPDSLEILDDEFPDDGGPVVMATPVRSPWVTYAAIGGGVLAAVIAFIVTYAIVAGGRKPAATPPAPMVADQPQPEEDPAPVVDAGKPELAPPDQPNPNGAVGQHRAAVDALVRAYNDLADGYAGIQGMDSIPAGNRPITRAAQELRFAAQRGRTLPALSPEERETLVQQTGPALLQAIDRVLAELRRLKTTDGLRGDFDGLIDSYTRTRQEVQREVDRG